MSEYTATKWDTVEDKQKFERQFKRFVESDFDFKKFPKWFYTRLSMCFGHIAHYNQAGFYDEFFRSTEGKAQFLELTVNYPCYGDPTFTYSDVEKVLRAWVTEKGLIEKYRRQSSREVETAERSELDRLKAKYEFTKVPS
jgi:hypothetical protein